MMLLVENRLGEKLTALRLAKGWSPAELARRAGLDPSAVSRIEAGSRRKVRLPTIQALAQALGVGFEELLGEAESEVRELSAEYEAVNPDLDKLQVYARTLSDLDEDVLRELITYAEYRVRQLKRKKQQEHQHQREADHAGDPDSDPLEQA